MGHPATAMAFSSWPIPSQGWLVPTSITLRLTPALGGTPDELLHARLEHVGGDVGAEHAGYEAGRGMTQLAALREVVGAG